MGTDFEVRAQIFWDLVEHARNVKIRGGKPKTLPELSRDLDVFSSALATKVSKAERTNTQFGLNDHALIVSLKTHNQGAISRCLRNHKADSGLPITDDYILLAAAYLAGEGSPEDAAFAIEQWRRLRAYPYRKRSGPASKVAVDDKSPVTLAGAVSPELRRYLTILMGRLEHVELPSNWGPSDPRLSSVFVPPPVTLIRPNGSFDPDGATPWRSAPDDDNELGTRLVRTRRATVVGAVGTGKGALMRGLAIAHIARLLGNGALWTQWATIYGLQEIDYLPIFIDLREVPEIPLGKDADWGELVVEALKPLRTALGADHAAVSAALLDRARDHKPVLLLLDGLDERPAAVRDALVLLANRLCTDCSGAAVVFSARWRPERTVDADLRADIFEIGSLTAKQAISFLKNYFRAAQGDSDDSAAQAAFDRFTASDLWRSVIANPLALLLLAPAILVIADEKLPDGIDPTAQLLWALLRRRESSRALAAQPCWEWPVAHLATFMELHEEQQIEEPPLLAELERGSEHLRKRHPYCTWTAEPDYTPINYARLMLDCGVLRQRTPDAPAAAGHRRRYDFFSDQIRSWLYASAIRGGWSPIGSAPLDNFIDVEGGTVRPERRDQLLEFIGLSDPITAASLIGQLIGHDNGLSLATVFRAMAKGHGPNPALDAILIEQTVARVTNGDDVDRALLNALAHNFAAPGVAPRSWGTILGLWLNLPGTIRGDFTVIGQPGWLAVNAYVERIRTRISGDNGIDSCAAMFEVLDASFTIAPYPLPADEQAVLEGITRDIVAQLSHTDCRAAFAAWALTWIYRARYDETPWLATDLTGRDMLLDLLGRPGQPPTARIAAAHLLVRNIRCRTDLAAGWATALDTGFAFGTEPLSPPWTEDHAMLREALEAALGQATLPRERHNLALAAAETGSTTPEVVEGVVSYAVDRPYSLNAIRAVRALSFLPDLRKAPALARIMCSSPEGAGAEEAMMALLATCERDVVLSVFEDSTNDFSADQRDLIEGLLFPDNGR